MPGSYSLKHLKTFKNIFCRHQIDLLESKELLLSETAITIYKPREKNCI